MRARGAHITPGMPNGKPENESTATVSEVRVVDVADQLHPHLTHQQLTVLLALIDLKSKED